MKKFFGMIFLILATALLFSSCGKEPQIEEPVVDVPQSEGKTSKVPEEPQSEPEEPEEFVFYQDHSSELVIRAVTEGIRISVEEDIQGEIPKVVYAEVPNELFYIEFKDGTPSIDHPAEYCDAYCYDSLESSSPESWKHYCVIECTYNGDYYFYEKNAEGVYELVSKEEKSEVPFGEYVKKSHYLGWRTYKEGIEDKNGNVILDPIYSSIRNIFGDRIKAVYGVKQSVDTARDFLFDENYNLLTSEYNDISYYFFEDYSYVGVAHCVGEDSEIICYDENGNVCESGAWFVDKDGKKISEKFEYIYMNINHIFDDDGNFVKSEPDGTANVRTENGEEKTVDVRKEYAIYSENTYANGYDPFLEQWVGGLSVKENYETEKAFPEVIGEIFEIMTEEKTKLEGIEVCGGENEFFAAYTYIDFEGAEQVLQVRMRKTDEGYGLLARGGGSIGYGLERIDVTFEDIGLE